MFTIPENQIKKLEKWMKEQDQKAFQIDIEHHYGAIGGGYSYTFTPTSIGTFIEVRNVVTGEKIDVSDSENF